VLGQIVGKKLIEMYGTNNIVKFVLLRLEMLVSMQTEVSLWRIKMTAVGGKFPERKKGKLFRK